jgi:hypothetical protein
MDPVNRAIKPPLQKGQSVQGEKSPKAESNSPSPSSVKTKRRVYRVGSVRVPLANPDSLKDPKNKVIRKFKQILDKGAAPPRPVDYDCDVFEPPIRKTPSGRRSVSQDDSMDDDE